MPNATAFVLSAIEESFTAVDASLATLRDATLSNRAHTHGAPLVPPLGDGVRVAAPSATRRALDAILAVHNQCYRVLHQIAPVATWMNTTLVRFASR
jgi:hypothetical protein